MQRTLYIHYDGVSPSINQVCLLRATHHRLHKASFSLLPWSDLHSLVISLPLTASTS